MKSAFISSLIAFAIADASSAHALDCAKASTPVEKLFCASPELKKADEAMSAAYFKLLRKTTDPEFHDALVKSQRRWLAARGRGPERYDGAEGDTTEDRAILLKMTRDRLGFLQGAEPIWTMGEQRETASKDGGGSFAGYETSCYFLAPPHGDWNYSCWGNVHRQHRERICSNITDWASGHFTERRLVSVLKNNELQPVASCSTAYAQTDEQCPEPDDDVETKAIAHWNSIPKPDRDWPSVKAGKLWKYDPDAEPNIGEQPWMRDCLSASIYPLPELSRPNSPKK